MSPTLSSPPAPTATCGSSTRGVGVTVTPVPALDRTTRLATTSCAAPAERLNGPRRRRALVDRGGGLAANDLAGIAREALTRTVQYDKDRVQFGVPVGSFQALKHALADLAVAVTMAEPRRCTRRTRWTPTAADAALAVSVAKAKASDTARDATAAMIQFHGGIGYTWEHDAHFYFKRAQRLEYAYGDAPRTASASPRLVVDQ